MIFPSWVVGAESTDRQGSALEASWTKVRSQTCFKDKEELLKGSKREVLGRMHRGIINRKFHALLVST